jgi:hypothetical protein
MEKSDLFTSMRAVAIILANLLLVAGTAGAGGPAAHDMQLVGTNDLQARSTYQPTVHKYSSHKYILFAGHHALDFQGEGNLPNGKLLPSFNPLTGQNELNGTSIVDVSDPRHPQYLFHLPVPNAPIGGPGGGAQMVRVCDGSTLPIHNKKIYMLRTYANSAHEIWDVTNPSNPLPVRTVVTNNPVIGAQTGAPGALAGTHKSWWECDTGIAYIVGRRATDSPGWGPGNHIFIFDLSDPANPVFLRDWALDGQQPGGVIPPQFPNPPGVPSIHGPISTGPAGGTIAMAGATPNRVYFAYGTGSNGVMQIVDRAALLSAQSSDFTTPELGRLIMNPDNGAHTSFPIGKITVPDFVTDTGNDDGNTTRDIVVVTSEATANFCANQFRHLTFLTDVSTVGRPQSIATAQVPASEGDFCDRGGRFGPHATNEEFGPPFYQKIVFVSYFNAGVRAFDIRDPYNPQNVAFFIPAITANTDYRCGPYQGNPNVCVRAIQTNNVATDDRGYIYIVDRANTGLHILRLVGDTKKIVESD